MALAGPWSLLLLAAVCPGVHLQENSSSIQDAENYQPVEETAPEGVYHHHGLSSSVLPSNSEPPTEPQTYDSRETSPTKGVHQRHSTSIQPAIISEPPTETQTFQSHEDAPFTVVQDSSSSVPDLSVSEEPTSAQIYHPVLQPSESIPPIGSYVLKTPSGVPCIRVRTGVEFIITEKKTWYLSLDPTRVKVGGYCGDQTAVLCLTLPNNAASLQFFFKKLQPKEFFCVTRLDAHLTPMPVCRGCANKTYAGVVANEEMFTTAKGQSYKCVSESLLRMSSELKIKLVPLQMQAFSLDQGQFGKEVECWADYSRRVVPIIIGAVVVCIILIGIITFLYIRDRRTEGYESL